MRNNCLCFLKAVGAYYQKKNKKSSTLVEFDETHSLWFLKPFEHESGYEKSLWCTSEGLHVDFQKNSILSFDIELIYIEVLKSQEIDLDLKICYGIESRSKSRFWQTCQL